MNSSHVDHLAAVKMLKPKVLTDLLQQAITDGITAAILTTTQGAPLAYSGATDQQCDVIAAIASNIWSASAKHGQTVLDEDSLHTSILDCQSGRMCIRPVTSLLLCVLGAETVPLGMLRAKTEALCSCLTGPLAEVAAFD